MRRATRLIHHPGATCPRTGAVSVPIYQVSTFRQQGVGRNQGYDYSRTANPTRDVLEDYIAELEGGAGGVAYGSGMAAISACIMLLDAGDHLLATEGLYGGTYRVLCRLFRRLGIEPGFVDTTDLEAVQRAFRDNTAAVLVETPSNPLMRISDMAGLAELCRRRGALLMVDNTFMSPWLQRPLETGADIVIHSATKFLGGHSDVILGLAVAGEESLVRRLATLQNAVGGIPGPQDCWIAMRGMKTLGVRMERSQRSARRIVEWLEGRKEVGRIYYPDPDHMGCGELHLQQADGPGAIVSFRLDPAVDPDAFLEALQVWTLAVSLGAVESIITQPARMTHLPYSGEERRRLGITDDLIRLSVGLEDPRDLIEDLEGGFSAGGRD